MGALKVGDLYVAVTASIGEAVASLGKLVKQVETTAKKVKEAADPVGKIGAVVAAGIGGAVLAASKSNQRLAAEVEHIQEVLYTFAAEVGDLFTPLVRRIGDFLSNLTAHFQRLSPQAKRAAASLAAWTAGIGLGVGVMGKLAGTVEGLAKGFGVVLKGVKTALPVIGKLGPVLNGVGPAASKALQGLQALMKADVGASMSKLWTSLKGMAPTMEGVKSGLASLGKSMVDFAKSTPSMLSSIGKMLMGFGAAAVPIIAVAAAIAGIALMSGAVYKNWDKIKYIATEAWGAMSESIGKMMDGLGEVADKLSGMFVAAFDGIGGFIKGIVERALGFVAFLVSGSARLLKPIAHAARMNETEKALEDLSKTTGESLGADIGKAFDSGTSAMAAVSKSLTDARDSLKQGVVSSVNAAAKAVGEGVGDVKDAAVYGLSDSWSGLKEIGTKLSGWLGMDKIGGLLKEAESWVSGNSEARIRQPGDMNGDLRQKGYDQLQSYADEDVKREANRALAADEENAARSLASLSDEADRATDELAENRSAQEGAREESRAAAMAERDRAYNSTMEMWQDQQRFASDAQAAMQEARRNLINRFIAQLGEMGSLLQTIREGATAGGWWGAIIAAIGELVMGSDQMAEAIDVFNGIIKTLKDLFGAAASGLDTIGGAVGYLVNVLTEVLKPTMEAMGRAMEGIAPIIVLVGVVLRMLAPALQAIGQASAWLLENVLKGLFQVLRYVAIAILYVIKGLGSAWNGIVSAIQWVFRKLGDISIFGAHPLGFLRGWADSMEGVKVDTESLARSIQELEGLTWDAAMAKAQETAEVLKNRDALADVNESLSNVPDLWKVALRRFDAQDEQDGPNTSPGSKAPSPSTPPSTTVGDPVTAPGGLTVAFPLLPAINLTVVGYDIDEAIETSMQTVDDAMRRLNIRRYGTSAAVSPRYA